MPQRKQFDVSEAQKLQEAVEQAEVDSLACLMNGIEALWKIVKELRSCLTRLVKARNARNKFFFREGIR